MNDKFHLLTLAIHLYTYNSIKWNNVKRRIFIWHLGHHIQLWLKVKNDSSDNRFSSFPQPFNLGSVQIWCQNLPTSGMVVVQPFDFFGHKEAHIYQLALIWCLEVQSFLISAKKEKLISWNGIKPQEQGVLYIHYMKHWYTLQSWNVYPCDMLKL